MTKRITLQMLKNWDNQHDSSIVRELEMSVDAVLIDSTYSIQFWKDVELYGIREALQYLQQTETVRKWLFSEEMKELEKLVDGIEVMILH